MGGCRCTYRTCKSATKISGELHFFHYPVKHRDRCNQWIRNARKFEFLDLPDDQLRNKVVCDLHFEQKFFTNIHRKRLVHDAIPTLNVGCEEDPSVGLLRDVQILPANDDGTIFTVDTDSMQQRSNSEPTYTYSFKNGTLVPVYKEDKSNTEQIVYTIDGDELKNLSCCDRWHSSENCMYNTSNENDDSDNYEIVFNGNSQINSNSPPPIPNTFVEVPQSKIIMHKPSEKEVDVIYVDHKIEDRLEIKPEPGIVVSQIRTSKRKGTKCEVNKNNKKFIQQINIHSREIASIKRTLQSRFKKSQKLGMIKSLKGHIAPTVLGALTLNLHKKKSNFTRDELRFITTLYKSSPETYKLFIDKLHWVLPDPLTVQNLIQNSNSG